MRAADYVQETTTSIATSGAGAVTLTALSSRPRFSTVFGTGKRWVRYVIEDTTNFYFEQGIGSVTSNVLTRTKPQITWDGTTWADGSAGAVSAINNFGGTPTSGQVIIRMAATAEAFIPSIHAHNSSIAGDTTWRDYPISGHIPWYGSGAGAALTNAREYYQLYRNDTAGLLNGAQLEVQTGAAGNLKWALYDVGSDGLPGAKVVDFVTISTTATAVKTDTATGSWTPATPIWLTPGWYYTAWIADNTCSLRCGMSTGSWLGRTPLGRAGSYGDGSLIFAAGTYASGLPATPAPSTMVTSNPTAALNSTWIGLKIVP